MPAEDRLKPHARMRWRRCLQSLGEDVGAAGEVTRGVGPRLHASVGIVDEGAGLVAGVAHQSLVFTSHGLRARRDDVVVVPWRWSGGVRWSGRRASSSRTTSACASVASGSGPKSCASPAHAQRPRTATSTTRCGKPAQQQDARIRIASTPIAVASSHRPTAPEWRAGSPHQHDAAVAVGLQQAPRPSQSRRKAMLARNSSPGMPAFDRPAGEVGFTSRA